MTIFLYKTQDENNKLNKNLTQIATLTGTLRSECSIINPVLDIQSDFIQGNYIYINEFKRYYFIDEIISLKNGYWEVHCSVDVLMSYKNNILQLKGVVSRSSNKFNSYLLDPSRLTQQNMSTYFIEFPKEFDHYTYLLVTSGSYNNIEVW